MTAGKLEGLPANFSKGKVKSLADIRMYVADTILPVTSPRSSLRGTASPERDTHDAQAGGR